MDNHNHRPCRWYAQAPLGPFICRAYRLIELPFACVFCSTTADAVMCVPAQLPLTRGLDFAKQKTGGEIILYYILSLCQKSNRFLTPPSSEGDFPLRRDGA